MVHANAYVCNRPQPIMFLSGSVFGPPFSEGPKRRKRKRRRNTDKGALHSPQQKTPHGDRLHRQQKRPNGQIFINQNLKAAARCHRGLCPRRQRAAAAQRGQMTLSPEGNFLSFFFARRFHTKTKARRRRRDFVKKGAHSLGERGCFPGAISGTAFLWPAPSRVDEVRWCENRSDPDSCCARAFWVADKTEGLSMKIPARARRRRLPSKYCAIENMHFQKRGALFLKMCGVG